MPYMIHDSWPLPILYDSYDLRGWPVFRVRHVPRVAHNKNMLLACTSFDGVSTCLCGPLKHALGPLLTPTTTSTLVTR